MPENGFWLPSRPSRTPTARGAVTGRSESAVLGGLVGVGEQLLPLVAPVRLVPAADARTRPAGRTVSTTRRSMSNSDLVSGSVQSETNSMKPEPASFRPMAMPASSSSLARSVGVYSPVRLLWLMVREVEKPKAPARMASAAIRRIWAMSASVAFSCRMARSPMT